MMTFYVRHQAIGSVVCGRLESRDVLGHHTPGSFIMGREEFIAFYKLIGDRIDFDPPVTTMRFAVNDIVVLARAGDSGTPMSPNLIGHPGKIVAIRGDLYALAIGGAQYLVSDDMIEPVVTQGACL